MDLSSLQPLSKSYHDKHKVKTFFNARNLKLEKLENPEKDGRRRSDLQVSCAQCNRFPIIGSSSEISPHLYGAKIWWKYWARISI